MKFILFNSLQTSNFGDPRWKLLIRVCLRLRYITFFNQAREELEFQRGVGGKNNIMKNKQSKGPAKYYENKVRSSTQGCS